MNAPNRRAKLRAQRFGLWAETRVVWRLRLRGWRIVARRWRGGGGEVDIVAARFGALAFVEVKARADASALADAWPASQRRRLERAARAFCARYKAAWTSARVDLALAGRWRVRYIANALQMETRW